MPLEKAGSAGPMKLSAPEPEGKPPSKVRCVGQVAERANTTPEYPEDCVNEQRLPEQASCRERTFAVPPTKPKGCPRPGAPARCTARLPGTFRPFAGYPVRLPGTHAPSVRGASPERRPLHALPDGGSRTRHARGAPTNGDGGLLLCRVGFNVRRKLRPRVAFAFSPSPAPGEPRQRDRSVRAAPAFALPCTAAVARHAATGSAWSYGSGSCFRADLSLSRPGLYRLPKRR